MRKHQSTPVVPTLISYSTVMNTFHQVRVEPCRWSWGSKGREGLEKYGGGRGKKTEHQKEKLPNSHLKHSSLKQSHFRWLWTHTVLFNLFVWVIFPFTWGSHQKKFQEFLLSLDPFHFPQLYLCLFFILEIFLQCPWNYKWQSRSCLCWIEEEL